MSIIASTPVDYHIIYGRSESEFYYISHLRGTVTLTIQDDYSYATAVFSDFWHDFATGNLAGGGFINVFGIEWGGHDFYTQYDPNALSTETFDLAWSQTYSAAGTLNDDLIWAIACRDSDYAYETRQGSFTHTFDLGGQEPTDLQVVTGFSRWNYTESDPGTPVVASVASYALSYPNDFTPVYTPYYPFARQNGSWLSCNRNGGSLCRYDGGWADVLNSEQSDYDNKAHYYNGAWSRCLIVGSE